MITRGEVFFAIICGVLGGLTFSAEAFHVFAVHNAPIVTGRVLTRVPIEQYSVPRVDFTIQIVNSDIKVHAQTQRYLMSKIPDIVRFRYNGDPNREVFLFEQENNPYLKVLSCWGVALALAVSMRLSRVRRALGWEK